MTLAVGWHDGVYAELAKERSDLARRFLDETDVIIPVPTIDLGSVNPAHRIMADKVAWLREITGQLEAGQ